MQKNGENWSETDIAIVGMAAHLPGADGIDAYWENLCNGVESIQRLDIAALEEAGETATRMRHKNYVPSASILKGFENFDADFFGLSPKEAAIMDPQHRQFLEVSWEALENSAHPPENFDGPIGVFAGCGMGNYFYFNICSNPDLVNDTGMFLLRHTGNDKDFLSTRLSHIFDLKGPSISVQTACSTSLVAVHYAAQSLLNGECDMALAGGVTIELPHGRGYIFEDGEILSPDGHCHAFDHRAEGTVFGSGAGVVVLRRLADAIADGDHIWGVIKGSAVNNDGSAKAGYLAPSVDGQAAAVADALAISDVKAVTIDYVECHGTGTYLGDPIEVEALSEAFRETTQETGFCRIGSVKTNIGHLDTAAGSASLIKTALSMHHGKIPATLGFEAPNPTIDFENSPFVVNSALSDWPEKTGPRRAGVNSLGVGGTNAHVVLEQAPEPNASEPSDWPFHVLTISGRSQKALDANTAALIAHLRAHPEQPLADVAFTLMEGRRAFERRRVVVAETHDEAAQVLEQNDLRRVFTHKASTDMPDTVFMFPGGGAQYAAMAQDLYETEPVFQDWMDRGFAVLADKTDYDLRALWLLDGISKEDADAKLHKPSAQLPLIMMVEFALARLWMSWGVTPAALVGHSMGENTAACLAGVMSFEDCLGLVLLRGQLFDKVPEGGMLSVPLPLADVTPLLGDSLEIAGINAPELTVVTGPKGALDALVETLAAKDIESQRIAIDIAAHSSMLDPILDEFRAYLQGIELRAPRIPIISNRSGAALLDDEATNPDYWVDHLRHTVKFADCITTLSQKQNRVYLEVGPGKALAALTRMHGSVAGDKVLSSLRHVDEEIGDDRYFVEVVGRLWACGAKVDWDQIWGDSARQRVVLPSYAFQRKPYFIEPGKPAAGQNQTELAKSPDLADWTYTPVWRPRLADCAIDVENDLASAPHQSWLVFKDDTGLGDALVSALRAIGHRVVDVTAGDAFGQVGPDSYVLPPERGSEGYDALVADLMAHGQAPDRIVHMWLVTDKETFRPGSSFFHRTQEQGLYALFFLARAIDDEKLPRPVHITTLTTDAAMVRKEGLRHPGKNTVLGATKVIPKELPGVTCSTVDIELGKSKSGYGKLINRILEDLFAEPVNNVAAYRGEKRFAQEYRHTKVDDNAEFPVWKQGGTYLVTGGFGGIGLSLAERMIRKADVNVILVARDSLPAPADRAAYLQGHGPNDKIARRIRAVQRLEALGGQILCCGADVCNVDEMKNVVAQATEKFGSINGVIHAAGVIDDAPLLGKTPSGIDDVLAPKLHGTQVLETLFPDGILDWLVLFSSSSTVTAPAGQIDYVAANSYLDAYAKSRIGGKTQVLALNWGLWAEVGMAAEATAARSGEPDIAPDVPTDLPLLDSASFDATGNRIFTTRLNASDVWVLDQHRTKDGQAIMPGTGYIELAAEALKAHGQDGPFELLDLMFLRPLQVAEGEDRIMRVRLGRSDEGYRFEVLSECVLNGEKGFQLHAEARVRLGKPPVVAPMNLADLKSRCTDTQEAEQGGVLASRQESHLRFGPRWQVLRSQSLGQSEGYAELALAEPFERDIDQDGYLLHPGLLDIATGWAMDLITGYGAASLWVPVSYERVQILNPLPSKVQSWVRISQGSREEGLASFDVLLSDTDGNPCVSVSGLTLRKLDSSVSFSVQAPLRANEVEFEQKDAAQRPLSAAEERLAYNVSQGILPDEGVQMFERSLASGKPQVLVSSLDLGVLIQQANQSETETSDGSPSFERPELDNDFVAPETDIERILAGFWQELLGVEQVGTQDSFFDLGGHSLIAVRLFAMVRKTYRVDFPISVLFEAPTIAKCAAMISERIGPQETGDAEAPVETPSRRFTHLVPMHDGEGGSKTPFFLVAGMFGNVLNLRHLAHLIGSDRPFYGLQARGLYGDEPPHETLQQAAADYIAELRIIQPQGPYLLGGFSGGGITAFEMAQQLEADGDEVSILVLLDTPLPVRRPLLRSDRLRIQWQELKSGGATYPFKWFASRVRWELSKFRAPQVTEISEQDSGQQFHNAEIETAFLRAVENYDMRRWNGRVSLFRPPLSAKWAVGGGRLLDSQRAYVFEDNDWGQWLTDLSVCEVPGDHDSMVLEPNVRVLAARIKSAIAQAESAAPQGFAASQAAE
jgi:acyl transferase domain-containing protein/thioesterase domain-containing protein/acyl carrier protein